VVNSPQIPRTPYLRPAIKLPQRTQLSQTEGRVVLAIQAFEQDYFTSLFAASTAYGAPYSTVRRRVNGRVARHDSKPTNRGYILHYLLGQTGQFHNPCRFGKAVTDSLNPFYYQGGLIIHHGPPCTRLYHGSASSSSLLYLYYTPRYYLNHNGSSLV
jgi:hypothetical protein